MTVILVRTALFYIILSAGMRFMGKRQIGEIQIGEFVSAVMISELAVLPIADVDIPITHGILGVIVLACLEIISSFLCRKSTALRRVLDGQSLVLVSRGKVIEENLTKSRISTDELFAAIRTFGLSGMDEVSYVILEQTGGISVIPAEQGGIAHTLIIDGKVQKRALAESLKSEEWLKAELSKRRLAAESLLYLTIDDSGNIKYEKKSGN